MPVFQGLAEGGLDWGSILLTSVRAELARRLGRRRLRFALRPLTNRRRNIRFRSQLGNELFELTFALVRGSGQDVFVVGVTQVLGQHSDTAQVKTSVLEHRKDHRILAGQTSCGDAPISFPFRQMQHIHAVVNHRRRSFASIESTRIDFGDVCDKNPLDTSRLR